MDFDLNDDQEALLSSLASIRQRYSELPSEERRARSYFAPGLQEALYEGGYFDAAQIGGLEAALVVLAIGESPCVAETGASALVVPHLDLPDRRGPFALLSGDLTKAQRFLPVARQALVDLGDDVAVIPVNADEVETVETIYAYPYGKFRRAPSLAKAPRLGKAAVATLRQWWRVAIAAESAAAAQSAVDFTVDYVKQRHLFGKPIASFQGVQHRIAACHQIARGMRFLALHAAWTGAPYDADVAASYAQQHMQKLVFDLHQFNGGMGVTNEHKLHFWTYRLRALQAEVGGADQASLDMADRLWGAVA